MRLAVVVMMGLVVGSSAQAQSPVTNDPFAIPRGPIACRERPVTSRDSAASIFDVIDVGSSERQRSFHFAFDSAGAPRYGAIMIQDGSDSTRFLEESIMVRLVGQPRGARLRGINGDVDTTGVGHDSVPGFPHGVMALTPDELSRTTVLARWVWDRRCAANRARPVVPLDTTPVPRRP